MKRTQQRDKQRQPRESQRGMSEMWWLIATAIIALLVVILILFWFRGSGGKAFGVVGEKIAGLQDRDSDNVADTFDKCPCDPTISDEWPLALQETKKCPKEC